MHITFFSLRDGSQGGKTQAEGEIYYGNFKNRTRRHRRHRTHPYRTHQQHASGRQGRCLRRPGERIRFSVAEKYGIKGFENPIDMINSPEIDAVMCTTSDPYHEEYVLASIAAGKYMFCETPLAPKADACQRIVKAERKAGKKLVQVGFMRAATTRDTSSSRRRLTAASTVKRCCCTAHTATRLFRMTGTTPWR